MRHALLGTLAAAFLWAAPAAAEPPMKVLDLGHPLSDTDPTWTGGKAFDRTETATFEKDGAQLGRFSADEHFGTHLDAPSHFGGSWTTDRIPVDRLVRPAVCIDIAAKAAAEEDYRLTVEDIRAFESRSGRIAEGTVVLVATGWDRRWKEPGRYMNVRNGVKHFPGVSAEAAALLARDRKVAGIGIDTPSVDHGPSEGFETHRVTAPLNVYHIENAANLTALPASGFTVVVAPVNIAGGSGAPARVFALLGQRAAR
jgi:kynurenine formamidase